MNISKEQINEILKTLPIGYYIKRDVPVELTDDKASNYNPIADKIRISYPQLNETFERLNESTTNVENKIRCMLYHEVSHAFLTPKNLEPNDIINIVEDERIESILRDYYLNVDFKTFVKEVNNYKGEAPKSLMSFFYQIVRYRIGPKELLDELHKLIMKHQFIYSVYSYKNNIEDFYDKVRDYWLKNINELQKQYNNKINASNEDSKLNDEGETNEDGEPNNSDTLENEELSSDSKTKHSINITTECEKTLSDECNKAEIVFERAANRYVDNTIINDMFEIFNNYKKANSNNSAAINAYSGVFSPRAVIRDDYKFFLQKNRTGHNKAYASIHLNLFIDCSGSFRCSDEIINRMLFALNKIEKQNTDFTYDLISCGMGQVIRATDDRIQKSEGGNDLTKEIFEQYKRVQMSNAQNINIICFDGDALSDTSWHSGIHRNEGAKNFRAFNNSNCVIISDRENESIIYNHCPNAKKIITSNYVSELYKHILKALKELCR